MYLYLRLSGRRPDKEIGPSPAPISQSSDGGKDTVVLYGSGTVRAYLNSSAPDIIEKLRKEKNVDLQTLEGPTRIGANTFAHIHDQSPHPVLVMASKRLTINELSPSNDKRPFVFEVYLGADTLQMLLATVR